MGRCDCSWDAETAPPPPHSPQEAQVGPLPTPAGPGGPGGRQELDGAPKFLWTKTLPPALPKQQGRPRTNANTWDSKVGLPQQPRDAVLGLPLLTRRGAPRVDWASAGGVQPECGGGAAVGEVEGRAALPSGSGAAQRRQREETPSREFGLRGDPGFTLGVGGGSARP